MKILLTGATGYIGKRLLPALLEQGHEVICCVRNLNRIGGLEKYKDEVSFWEIDFLKEYDESKAPKDFDVAYYLIHSMASSTSGFSTMEKNAAKNFTKYINSTKASQIIYLTGIVNEENLSKHLQSRKTVEKILSKSQVPLTVLRAGIVVGSGSASFEIIRDLVEKLPIMLAPTWLKTQCQPIGVGDVVKYLTGCLLNEETYRKSYDIGGSDVLTYKDMLFQYAEIRNLKRYIISVPVFGLQLSSYWLYFITSTSYKLAYNLVDSMRVKVVAQNDDLEKLLQVKPASYKQAVEKSFQKINENVVLSSWKDSFTSSAASDKFMDYAEAPEHGVVKETREVALESNSPEEVLDNIWAIGGKRGWYYGNILWKIRGLMDKIVGGTGLRRGRTHPKNIYNGDALDFWRVIVADKLKKRLLLYSEMKVPGEAWLEFKIDKKDDKPFLLQTATFRPHGLWGRVYWYALFPAHLFIFSNMAKRIAEY